MGGCGCVGVGGWLWVAVGGCGWLWVGVDVGGCGWVGVKQAKFEHKLFPFFGPEPSCACVEHLSVAFLKGKLFP
jgi:hypothetical protein